MELYNEKDLALFKDKAPNIIEKAELIKLETLDPKKSEIKAIVDILLDFIREKKRKIYGGYAVNLLIKDKNPRDVFYKEHDYPDIEFYSPQPLQDLIHLANLYHKKGYPYVSGKAAQHLETYTLFINMKNYCDISYVPWDINKKIPFKLVNGLTLTHPYFMTIDYMRIFTDPLNSYKQRLEKAFKRFYLLQKYYPLPNNTNNSIKLDNNNAADGNDINKLISKDIENFIINNPNVIASGWMVYNKYIDICQIKDKNIKKVNIPYYEFTSINYATDATGLIDMLKKKYPEQSDKITYQEFYPFFQFLGFSVKIQYNGRDIAHIYHHNKVCRSYKRIQLEGGPNYVNIASFNMMLLMLLSQIMKYRMDNLKREIDNNYTMISHIIKMRDFYLKQRNKSIFDDTVFQEFVPQCIGETMDISRENRLLGLSNLKLGKKFRFEYYPDRKNNFNPKSFGFAKSSGEPIKSVKNLKLFKENKETYIPKTEEEDDDEVFEKEAGEEEAEVGNEAGEMGETV